MAQPALRVPTFEELYRQLQALPEGVTGEILEPGLLRTMGRPGGPHRFAAWRIRRTLQGSDLADGGAGWWFEIEAQIRFPDALLAVPDIAGWRVAEQPAFVDGRPIEVLPDFCCEILSPQGARDDRRLKSPLYARSGVAWIWLADPEHRLVEVHQTIEGLPALVKVAKDDDTLVLPPFEGQVAIGCWWKPAPGRSAAR